MRGESRQDPVWHLFIAYSHDDYQMALSLFNHLHADYRVFLDAKCVLLGDAWDEQVPAAQKQSLVTVVLISQHTESSWFQREEIASAIQLAKDRDSEHRVVPVYIDSDVPPKEVPYGLQRLHGVIAGMPSDMKEVATNLTQTLRTLGFQPSTSTLDHGPELSVHGAATGQHDAQPKIASGPDKRPQRSAPALTPPFKARAGMEWTDPTTGIAFVFVPPGRYIIGGGSGIDENPRHTVLLSGFWLGKYPITISEYRRTMKATDLGGARRRTSELIDLDEGVPVVQISWHEAMAFCDRMGVLLPTEIQWEAAARGTKGRRYPWGKEEPTADRCNFDTCIGRPTDVHRYGSMGMGPYGTLDQCGNVWEWCFDAYRQDTYRARCMGHDAVADARTALGLLAESLRVARGGSWKDGAEMLRSSRRVGMASDIGYDNVGFRVCIPQKKE